MPRSGSTWLGKILDSHPDTLYRHEPDGFGHVNDLPLLVPPEQAGSYASRIEEFVRSLPHINHSKVSGKLPTFPKSYYSSHQLLFKRTNSLVSKLLGRVAGEFPLFRVKDYQAVRDLRVVWKSIESLGRLGALASLMPEATAIHLIRHPCGYVQSVLRGEEQGRFVGSVKASEDFPVFEMLLGSSLAREQGVTLSDLKACSPLERLAWRWTLFNEQALEDTSGLPNCQQVLYEELCTNPESVIRKLFERLHLDWNPQVVRFIRRSTAVNREGFYSVYKNPRLSAEKWRTALSPSDVKRVTAIASLSRAGRMYAECLEAQPRDSGGESRIHMQNLSSHA